MRSLALTREVLYKSRQLETLIPRLQLQVKVVLNQMDAIQLEKHSLVKKIPQSKERLSEIALNPNTLTETDYLELLIASEEQEKKPGWNKSVKQFHVLLKEAEVLKSVSHMEIKGRRDQ